MKLSTSVSLIVALAVLLACRNSNESFTPVILGVSSVDAPTSISSGSPINVTLNVQVGGCLTFDRLEVNRSSSGASIIAWGHDITEGIKDRGILCTRVMDESHKYAFDPPFGGTFTLWVERGRLSPLITTVTVN